MTGDQNTSVIELAPLKGAAEIAVASVRTAAAVPGVLAAMVVHNGLSTIEDPGCLRSVVGFTALLARLAHEAGTKGIPFERMLDEAHAGLELMIAAAQAGENVR